ncbi:trypsin-7 [Plutella xylostella]|uniref:trypsin-7 n=1 Tax=Plutella xylostella TaxID=51655 RepID=UPI002032BF56|nr:trypsin-7 [Plutella xylostella]
MFISISIIVVVVQCFNSVDSGRVKRVIGGSEVECGSLPRVASLRNSSSLQHLCGATLLGARHALTAAHCVSPASRYYLQLSNMCVETGEVVPNATVAEIVVHEGYNKYTRAHDIALLKIKLNLKNSNWLDDENILPYSSFGVSGTCIISGYGVKNTTSMELSETLMTANLKIISLDECTRRLGIVAPKHDAGMMCAVGDDATDSCQGDSGGPLLCAEGRVEGISSHGLACAPGVPAVYTSVAAHLHWIRNLITNY